METIFGTATPAVADCLALLDLDVTDPAQLNPAEEAAVPVIWDRMNARYGQATPTVLDTFDTYCAYCRSRGVLGIATRPASVILHIAISTGMRAPPR